MTNQVDGTIILARWFDKHNKPQKVTVQDYLIFVENQDQTQISNFIYHRLYRRYLKPFLFEDKRFKKEFKNGFSIMANCCLLIETLESFKNGWSDSDRKSEQAFIQFFKSETNFFAFKDKEKAFYKNIRCGILHQGETTGGWKINRNEGNIFNSQTLDVDSVTFAKELEESLYAYSLDLKFDKWDSETWDNFRTKMRKIILNCQKQ